MCGKSQSAVYAIVDEPLLHTSSLTCLDIGNAWPSMVAYRICGTTDGTSMDASAEIVACTHAALPAIFPKAWREGMGMGRCSLASSSKPLYTTTKKSSVDNFSGLELLPVVNVQECIQA